MATAVLTDERALILAPLPLAAQTSSLLTDAGFVCLSTSDARRVTDWLAEGAGLLIVANSTLPDGPQSPLQVFIDQQPEWSDLPIVLLVDSTLPADSSFSSRLGNLAWLQSPFDGTQLLNMSQAALRSRRRQYIARDRLLELQRRLEEQQRSGDEQAWHQARKMDAVGQLAGGIAHDFNNLLTSIGGSFELIDKRVRQGRTEQLETVLRMGREAVARAARLTHQLLAFSSRQSLQSRIVDLRTLLQPETLQASLGVSITLHISVPANLWLVKADDKQLQEVLGNLLVNACEAMPSGGQLNIEASNQRLDSACLGSGGLSSGDYLCLSIRDNGHGMSQSTLEHAFEPFFTTKPIGQGIGLGLSMVYGFSKQSHGHVALHSQIGQGTQVDLYLPRYHGRSKRQADVQPTKPPGSNRDVLVVEDDPNVRQLVCQVLREEGFPCQAAGNANEALKLLERPQPFALMVSDVGLPGMSGRQLAQIARKRQPELQVLFITGYAETAMARDDFLEPGMQLISKPFELCQLRARVAHMLGES